MQANLMNATGNFKRPVKPDHLLPEEYRSGETLTVEDVKRQLEEKRQRFEAAAKKRGHLKIAK